MTEQESSNHRDASTADDHALQQEMMRQIMSDADAKAESYAYLCTINSYIRGAHMMARICLAAAPSGTATENDLMSLVQYLRDIEGFAIFRGEVLRQKLAVPEHDLPIVEDFPDHSPFGMGTA